jgi:membrane-associated phospholipid phosphatase
MLSIKNILYNIGYFGDIILFLSSLVVLRNNPVFLSFYTIGLILNYLINEFLKFVIQEPRPKEQKDFTKSPLQMLLGLPNTGMPSQHAQSSFYSTIFVFFSKRDAYWDIYFILITIITCIQRVLSNSHTIKQVFVGSLLGMFIGYIFYRIAFNRLKKL